MTIQQTDIQNALIDFVSNQLLNDPSGTTLTAQDDLLSSNLVDSLGVMRIVAFLETRYGFRVPPTDIIIENFIDIETISNYLKQHLAADA